jgi:LysR family glycine cleavage system transcriptional activator
MKYPVHLNALRAFEASARHQSFSAAALELYVTSAAVGQQVRGLEEWLGTPLFVRSTRGAARLIPTDIAERALPDIRAGFEKLSIGLARLKEASTSGTLTVTVSPAFAAKWLLPRIDRFQQAFPQTDLRLDTTLKMLDFQTHGIDIGVRYGGGRWPGLIAEKLMDEEIFPVCSPRLMAENKTALRHPEDLAGHTLIHDLSMEHNADFPTWASWLNAAGLGGGSGVHGTSGIDTRRGMRINNSAAVVQAAVDGHGVALGRSVMVRDDLAAGRLIRLFSDIHAPSGLAYYVVSRPECQELPRLSAFRKWLLDEAMRENP